MTLHFKNFDCFAAEYLRVLKGLKATNDAEWHISAGKFPGCLLIQILAPRKDGLELSTARLQTCPDEGRLVFEVKQGEEDHGSIEIWRMVNVSSTCLHKAFRELTPLDLEEEGIKHYGHSWENRLQELEDCFAFLLPHCCSNTKHNVVRIAWNSWSIVVYPEAVRGCFAYHPLGRAKLTIVREKDTIRMEREFAQIKYALKKAGVNS